MMAMTEPDFINAVQTAVTSNPKAGTKWNLLESLFAASALRGNGAINNSGGADRTTRIRQLGTSKVHAGHDSRAVANHSVFVIGGDTVNEYKRTPKHYEEQIAHALKDEHADFSSCLVMLAETGTPVKPVLLIKRTTQPLPLPYEGWWPQLPISIVPPSSVNKTPTAAGSPSPATKAGTNIIFYGSPGTGKSTDVKRIVSSEPMFRTQFHPEYSHADLIGSYRPVVGFEKDANNQILGHDGMPMQRPVNYFSFVPGPLTEALTCAFGTASALNVPSHVFLVIEEINRGDCAAIFGDAFQLLDRDDDGQSEYGITPKPDLLAYFNSKKVNYNIASDGKLYFPPNLTLLATMNTSDQSLYPMDSAFKRRWQWVSCPIEFNQLLEYTAVRPFLDDGKTKWDWIGLLERINKYIVQDRMEDKQIGPWFIKPAQDGTVAFETFLNKCLFYLWHDVFKDEQLSDLSPFKADGPEVFGSVQSNIQKNGLLAGFKAELLTDLALGLPAMQASAAHDTVPEAAVTPQTPSTSAVQK
jgi:hypothetical protein